MKHTSLPLHKLISCVHQPCRTWTFHIVQPPQHRGDKGHRDKERRKKILRLLPWHAGSLLIVPPGTPTISKDPACQGRRRKRCRFNSWVRKIPWRRAQQPTPVFLPGECHGQRSLVGYSLYGCKVKHDRSGLAQHGTRSHGTPITSLALVTL